MKAHTHGVCDDIWGFEELFPPAARGSPAGGCAGRSRRGREGSRAGWSLSAPQTTSQGLLPSTQHCAYDDTWVSASLAPPHNLTPPPCRLYPRPPEVKGGRVSIIGGGLCASAYTKSARDRYVAVCHPYSSVLSGQWRTQLLDLRNIFFCW